MQIVDLCLRIHQGISNTSPEYVYETQNTLSLTVNKDYRFLRCGEWLIFAKTEKRPFNCQGLQFHDAALNLLTVAGEWSHFAKSENRRYNCQGQQFEDQMDITSEK